MGEKPSPLGEDFGSIFCAARGRGVDLVLGRKAKFKQNPTIAMQNNVEKRMNISVVSIKKCHFDRMEKSKISQS